MRLLLLVVLVLGSQARADEPLVFPGANQRASWFTVHNLTAAQALSRGRGARVGILDHSFGIDAHPGLYAGSASFQTGLWGASMRSESHHGYWMALAVKAVAPEAAIFALGTYSSDEASRANAMIAAIDWAIAHKLDVLSYSAERFSPPQQVRLEAAAQRARAAGIVTVFLHDPDPQNLMPTWIGPRAGDDEREPDVNVYQYDYDVLLPQRYAQWKASGRSDAREPFLSLSATAAVTAGVVALVRSVSPDMPPRAVKALLISTSRAATVEGMSARHVLDARAAVETARASTHRPQ